NTPSGTRKLSCVGDTKNKGARTPLTRTFVPASSVGSGIELAAIVVVARPVPKAAAIAWGARASAEKLAAETAASERAAPGRVNFTAGVRQPPRVVTVAPASRP